MQATTGCVHSILQEVQSLAGTPYYMSPECLKGIGYNAKSDVWSLACVVYELCNLEMPFKGDSLLTLTKLICDGDIPPV
jgi:serine/threonine protein kinase